MTWNNNSRSRVTVVFLPGWTTPHGRSPYAPQKPLASFHLLTVLRVKYDVRQTTFGKDLLRCTRVRSEQTCTRCGALQKKEGVVQICKDVRTEKSRNADYFLPLLCVLDISLNAHQEPQRLACSLHWPLAGLHVQCSVRWSTFFQLMHGL